MTTSARDSILPTSTNASVRAVVPFVVLVAVPPSFRFFFLFFLSSLLLFHKGPVDIPNPLTPASVPVSSCPGLLSLQSSILSPFANTLRLTGHVDGFTVVVILLQDADSFELRDDDDDVLKDCYSSEV